MTSHPASPTAAPRSAGSWRAAAVCAAAGLVVFQFFGNATRGYIDTASLFYWWGFQWINPASETQHGWLVLALSGWLLWKNLRESAEGGGRRAERAESNLVGNARTRAPLFNPQSATRSPQLAALSVGLLLHTLGFAVQQSRISIVGLLCFTWGVLALGGGRRWARASLFPVAFLVFAIPLNVLDSVGFWLRVSVVDISSALARIAHIDVVRNGTQLFAPDGRYQYDVAAACSGVRSLMALAALSLLVGYLNFRSAWRRALMLLLCFPLALLGNVARITAIIAAAQFGGQRWGDRAHDVMGFGVFVIVLGGVFGAAVLLEKFRPEKRDFPATERRVARGGVALAPFWVATITVVLAIADVALLGRIAHRPSAGVTGIVLDADGTNPAALPTFLGSDWIGRRSEVTAIEREILPPDTGFSRKLYFSTNDPNRAVFVSVVLSGRDRTSIHRPELCLVGQGWTIERTDRHAFSGGPRLSGKSIPATLLHTVRADGKGKFPALVAYWFVSGDAMVATHTERFLHDAWNRLRHGRADRWAYVLMQTDARDGDAAALARLQAVLDQTLPGMLKAAPRAAGR